MTSSQATSLQKYTSFIKLEHSLFSLPLLFAGAILANVKGPTLREFFLILVAGAGARVIAMSLNRIIDRHIDKLNPRTKERHLASGSMKLREAWAVVVVGLIVYLVAAWCLSDFCLKLSWIPVVAFLVYPYFKRFTKWTHVGLGLVWSLVPLAGFFAVKQSADGIAPAICLGLFSIFWLAGFDIIYATLDESFDREARIFSLPAAWGSPKALRVAGLFHLIGFFVLVFLYGIWFSGPFTVLLLASVGLLLFLEQRLSKSVNIAFFQMNVLIGFAVFFFVLSGLKGF